MLAHLTRRRVWLGLALLIIVVIGIGYAVSTLTSPQTCPVAPATEQNFADAIAMGEGIFEPELWELRSEEHPALISVGWFEDEHDAYAHGQYLLYNCGYTQTDLDQFYDEDGFDYMLGGYDSWTQTAICEQDGITLREFDVVYVGRPYIIRYWVEPVSDTRVRDIHLGFYADDIALMEDYAARLYPGFSSCST